MSSWDQANRGEKLGLIWRNRKKISSNYQLLPLLTDKKENQIFLLYKEIQSGAVAKSYMTNDLLIYGEIFAHFLIY
jgi:hypothetical protein